MLMLRPCAKSSATTWPSRFRSLGLWLPGLVRGDLARSNFDFPSCASTRMDVHPTFPGFPAHLTLFSVLVASAARIFGRDRLLPTSRGQNSPLSRIMAHLCHRR